MRKLNQLLLGLCVVCFALASQTASAQYNWPWKWDKNTIVTETPARPAGQKDVLNLKTPKLDVVRVAFVGLGMRGPGAVERWTHIPGIQVVALCDYDKNRAENCQKILKKVNMPEAAIYSGEEGYKELCKRPDIDVVYIATDWKHHFLVAKCALENGKNAAIEVPSAMNLTECWELINLSEKTQKHCMILENCCYDEFEMTALNMAQKGLFGEVLRAQGAYIHCLDPYWDYYWKNGKDDKLGWRMEYNKDFRGDVYATHGLGPVAQALNIHRGDRFTTLVAMDTKAVHGPEYVKSKTGKECTNYQNGDHTTTLMRTADGKVVEIQHNVMNPQPYNRLYQLTGTKGFANKYPVEGYSFEGSQLKGTGVAPKVDKLDSHSFISAELKKELEKEFQHPIYKKYREMAKKVGGHGGMDFIMDSRLVYCLQNGLPLDMDVYDLAEWCCLAELGTLSMDNNCAPVSVPDFTRGHWNDTKGYNHAYASAEDEANADKIATTFTTALQEAVKNGKTGEKATAEAYKAVAKVKKQIAKEAKASKK